MNLDKNLGNYEKALYYLSELNRQCKDAEILNRMGTISGEMRDYKREEKFYREAARNSPHSGSLFNLALSQDGQGEFQTAMQTIDEAIAVEREPSYLVLKARLADRLGQTEQRDALLAEAFEDYDTPSELCDWELSWYRHGAKLAGDKDRIRQAEVEQNRRKTTTGTTSEVGHLPDKAGGITKVG